MSRKFDDAVAAVLNRFMSMDDEELERRIHENKDSDIAEILRAVDGFCLPENFSNHAAYYLMHERNFHTSRYILGDFYESHLGSFQPEDSCQLAA